MSVPLWWQDAIAYQIYPRSFADANRDGIGDLPGIIEKLDYLQDLGVTAVWLSPFYPSPLVDVGYDIANYVDVDPDYGTLADFDRLVDEAHRRGIRLLLDFVLNHTSDQHAWFQASRSSRDNPYREWYIWRDGKNGGPPNDWETFFGGSAWTLDPVTGQYYYHAFFPEQPDLNWRNPEVQEAMFNVARFWLARGADGFRLDALGTLFEDEALPDSNFDKPMTQLLVDFFTGRNRRELETQIIRKMRYQFDLPETFTIMTRLRQVCDEYPDRVLLGETEDMRYYGSGSDMLHSVFNFELTDVGTLAPEAFRALLTQRWPKLPAEAWEANTLGNHDRSRAMTLYADGQHDQARMRVALALVMFLRGTPVFYNGEEIGMSDITLPDIALFRDTNGINAYRLMRAAGVAHDEALRLANWVSRDKCRAPMQWSAAPNAGFSPPDVTTWLPVYPNYVQGVNVADQLADPASLLHAFRQMARVRQAQVALRRGDFELIENDGPVFAFWRRVPGKSCLVALNMSAQPAVLAVDGSAGAEVVYASHAPRPLSQGDGWTLAPYAVVVARLTTA